MGGSSSNPKTCEVQFWDFPDRVGAHLTLALHKDTRQWRVNNLGTDLHSIAGNWNDDIQSIELRGPNDDCWVTMCEHTHMRGRCLTFDRRAYRSFPWGSQLSNTMSSLAFGKGRRSPFRRLEDGEETFTEEGEEMEETAHDPLCEALYEDGFASNWEMFANSTIKDWEVQKLAKTCEAAYEDSLDVDSCKFNVYAGAELLEDADIVAKLKMDPKEENPGTERERCTLLVDEIFNTVKAGKLSGVEVEHLDGVDYFMMDEPVTASNVDLIPEDGELAAVVSAGSLLAMWIGKTVIRVGRAMTS